MANQIIANFNGVDLSSYFVINRLDRGIGIPKKMETKERKNKTGVQFLGLSSSLYSFPMEITLIDHLNFKRKELAAIFNVDEPKKLHFSDEPNIYYLAYPSIATNIAELLNIGRGTIIWEIPDGVAYSKELYTFTNKNSPTNSGLVSVQNPGTEPMDLELTAKFSSDNGFLGIMSQDESVRVLLGDPEEVDGVHYKRSETLFNDHLHTDRMWARNAGVVPPVTNPPPVQQGTPEFKLESLGEGYVKPASYGPVKEKWHGPSLTKTIPPDSEGLYPEKWTATWRMDFNPVGAGSARPFQVGHQSMTFLDQNNNIILSIVVEDNSPTAEKSDIAFYIGNERVFDLRNTNDYYNTARPGEGNQISVENVGEYMYVFWGTRENKDFFVFSFQPPAPGVQLRKITWYAAKFQSFPAMQNNLLRAINVVKHNVTKWRDIPNKFKAGDVLTYGRREKNLYCEVNGMNELRLRDVGSTFITVPPGDTLLYLTQSSFATVPEVILQGRAKYSL